MEDCVLSSIKERLLLYPILQRHHYDKDLTEFFVQEVIDSPFTNPESVWTVLINDELFDISLWSGDYIVSKNNQTVIRIPESSIVGNTSFFKEQSGVLPKEPLGIFSMGGQSWFVVDQLDDLEHECTVVRFDGTEGRHHRVTVSSVNLPESFLRKVDYNNQMRLLVLHLFPALMMLADSWDGTVLQMTDIYNLSTDTKALVSFIAGGRRFSVCAHLNGPDQYEMMMTDGDGCLFVFDVGMTKVKGQNRFNITERHAGTSFETFIDKDLVRVFRQTTDNSKTFSYVWTVDQNGMFCLKK